VPASASSPIRAAADHLVDLGLSDPVEVEPGVVDRSGRVGVGVYSTLTPARSATSLRRSPGTRRLRLEPDRPACSGEILARRELRKALTSARLSTSPG
jgi:hypothetical protein